MTKFTFSAAFESVQSSKPSGLSRQKFNQQALVRRLDRLGSRSYGARSGALAGAPQHLDARLLEDGAAFEAAWQAEILAMVGVRRSPTPQAEAALQAARAAVAAVVGRIETARALTLDGLKIQARAVLWRRDGEPLGPEAPDEHVREEAWTGMSPLPYE